MDPKTIKNIKMFASYFVSILSPALATLMASIESIYNLNQLTSIIAVLGAVTTFIGTVAKVYDVKSSNSDEVK